MNYEEMLNKALKELPEEIHKDIRFEIPKVDSFIQGNKTIFVNFKKIADYVSRDPNHLLKFLSNELATQGEIKNNRAIFVGKFKRNYIQEKIDKYAKEYVFCSECGKPDTKLVKEGRLVFLKCLACGARKPVKNIK